MRREPFVERTRTLPGSGAPSPSAIRSQARRA